MAEVPVTVALIDKVPTPKYQAIADKALHLSDLGLSEASIARQMGVAAKTVGRAVKWGRGETLGPHHRP